MSSENGFQDNGPYLFRSKCKYNPDFCDLLVEHMRGGFTFESFSGRVGVHPSTIYKWKQKYPEFSEACEIGFRAALYHWEQIHKNAADGTAKGNAAAIIFKLKNTFREWYKDRQEIDHTHAAEIRVSTGIGSKASLPDVDGEVVRKRLGHDAHARNLLESKQYVDFEELEKAVLDGPQAESEPEEEEDIL